MVPKGVLVQGGHFFFGILRFFWTGQILSAPASSGLGVSQNFQHVVRRHMLSSMSRVFCGGEFSILARFSVLFKFFSPKTTMLKIKPFFSMAGCAWREIRKSKKRCGFFCTQGFYNGGGVDSLSHRSVRNVVRRRPLPIAVAQQDLTMRR